MMISPRPPSTGCAAAAPWPGSRAYPRRWSRPPTGARRQRWEALRIFGQRAPYPPLAQLLALDPRLRGDEPLGQLRLRHLEAEQRHRASVFERGVLGDVAHQRALAHRRAGGDDDQVAGLKAAGDLVEVLEARRGPRERGPFEGQPVELVELLVEDVLDLAEVLLAVVTGDLEHRLLGLLDEVPERSRARSRSTGFRRRLSGAGAGAPSRARSGRSGGRVRRPARGP